MQGETLLVGTDTWSLAATCDWQWVANDRSVVDPTKPDVSDAVWDLIGETVVSVRWSGPRSIGDDPVLMLESGGHLEFVSDAHFDTWVIQMPNLVLVGPLHR
jgi:hypothetical protein